MSAKGGQLGPRPRPAPFCVKSVGVAEAGGLSGLWHRSGFLTSDQFYHFGLNDENFLGHRFSWTVAILPVHMQKHTKTITHERTLRSSKMIPLHTWPDKCAENVFLALVLCWRFWATGWKIFPSITLDEAKDKCLKYTKRKRMKITLTTRRYFQQRLKRFFWQRNKSLNWT